MGALEDLLAAVEMVEAELAKPYDLSDLSPAFNPPPRPPCK